MIYRKGELSAAMVDRDWPHQAALPASASAERRLPGGSTCLVRKDLSLCRAVTRSSTKANGSTSIVSPSRSMPRNSCTGSAARN